MLPSVNYQFDTHLRFAPVETPHPRNAATIARLRKAFESYSLAKFIAKGRNS